MDQTIHVKVKCDTCKHEWNVCPSTLLRGHGCPSCKGKAHSDRNRKPFDQFVEQLKRINSKIEIIGNYTGTHDKILCRCLVCNVEWEATPHNLLHGSGCPHCKKSNGEKKIQEYLESKNIPFIAQYSDPRCRNHAPLRFDFAITTDSKKSIVGLVEYDGQQHYEGVDFSGNHNVDECLWKVQQNDQIKNEFCKVHNILLLRISYWEYDNIDEQMNKFINKIKQKFKIIYK